MGVFSPDAEHLQPKQIVKSLVPAWNKLVFFEVSPVSFHQVKTVRQTYSALGMKGLALGSLTNSVSFPLDSLSHQDLCVPS